MIVATLTSQKYVPKAGTGRNLYTRTYADKKLARRIGKIAQNKADSMWIASTLNSKCAKNDVIHHSNELLKVLQERGRNELNPARTPHELYGKPADAVEDDEWILRQIQRYTLCFTLSEVNNVIASVLQSRDEKHQPKIDD